jgi:hypothetical protein
MDRSIDIEWMDETIFTVQRGNKRGPKDGGDAKWARI